MEQPIILVAEDEPIVGMDLCDTIAEAGYQVEGPHGDLNSAMLAFQKQRPDLAILDIRLHDTVVYPFAEKLIAENVPVIFHSGHLPLDEVSTRFPGTLALAKPCPPGDILTQVHTVLTREQDEAQPAGTDKSLAVSVSVETA
ncbi:response regulator [Alteriqipengyuania lutimaris]|uniref:Response regulator n=1 Tax=Alteriqipengyuania lutimaris TaxID=1538146 RepID=A0A395LJC9_9SPHN|nr:response regulator [Alteriqipengyuania lutimaris]MBB3033926.1 DNA-binding response OmpR family regulator [Alteriqipengyuania lutimaris]RDS77116.1 response regulator [Alteriqipengyuania lutimaris]